MARVNVETHGVLLDVGKDRKMFDSVEVFGELAKFLKKSENYLENMGLSIPIVHHDENVGYLVPVGKHLAEDESLAADFCRWRANNQHAFPLRFHVTMDGTKNWLRDVVYLNPNKLIFLVLNHSGARIGHIGLATNEQNGRVELDSVLRGEDSDPGLMSLATLAIENFAEKELSLEQIYLRVLASNLKAIAFYEKLGYIAHSRDEVIVIDLDAQGNKVKEARDQYVTMVKALGSTSSQGEILTAGPLVGSLERLYAMDASVNGWNNQHSKYILELEQEFARLVGSKYAMATSSCTGALHLALLACGIGPGDEVIVPDITWVATASAVLYVGATPVFCDVDEHSWTLDPESARKAITSRTKAIMPVHLYGFPAKMDSIVKLAGEYGLRIIEDAAPAIGAKFSGKSVGTFGDLGCFSFQGAKLLVSGEGGMLVTDDSELFARAKKLQEHGRKPGTFWIEELGHKYKMPNIAASIALAQLQRAGNQIHRKSRIRNWYEEDLGGISSLTFQSELPSSESIHWMTSVVLGEDLQISVDDFRAKLLEKGIDTRPVFPTISRYSFWPEKKSSGPKAGKIAERGVNLPSGVNLSRADIRRVSDAIKWALGLH